MVFESFPNTKYLLPNTEIPVMQQLLTTHHLPFTTPDVDNMPNTHLPFGIDLSKWNTSQDGKQKVDFDIINATNPPRVSFVAMRAGISWGYQDPWFNYYFQEGQRIGKILMPYHVIFPGQPAQRQMDNFFRIMGDIDYKTTPLVLDLELDHDQPVSTITKTTLECISIIVQRTQRIPIIYSRAQWANTFLKVQDLPPVHWWLAQYRYSLPYPLYTPEFPCPPTLPAFVGTWLFHQTTHRGRSIGAPGLYFMDHNRFNGTLEELYKFAGFAAPNYTLATCPLDQQPCVRGLPQPYELPQPEGRDGVGRDGAAGKTVTTKAHTFRVQLQSSRSASETEQLSAGSYPPTSYQPPTISHQLSAKDQPHA